jgi:hypothetical protein
MIIKGNARGNAKWLAGHLQRTDTNERADVLEIRGTASQNLEGAFREIMAVSSGTKCRDALYHANIDPRGDERLTPEQWSRAIDTLENKLGFTGQPRAVVRHVKNGREHVHVVWSRIDADRMRAIPDSHNYRKHEEVSRQLEREFGHKRVQGALAERDGQSRPDRTPTQGEMEQGKRVDYDARRASTELTAIWQRTDSGKSFAAALEEAGWCLAKGDRRDFVALDPGGGVHSVARRIEGARAKDVRERLKDLDREAVPDVEQARAVQAARAKEASLAPQNQQDQEARKPTREDIEKQRQSTPRCRWEEENLTQEQGKARERLEQQLKEKHAREWQQREKLLKQWEREEKTEDQQVAKHRRAEDQARKPKGLLRKLASKTLDALNPARVRKREAEEKKIQQQREADDNRRAEIWADRKKSRDEELLRTSQNQEKERRGKELQEKQEQEREALRQSQLDRLQREQGRETGRGGREQGGRDDRGRGRDDDGGRGL